MLGHTIRSELLWPGVEPFGLQCSLPGEVDSSKKGFRSKETGKFRFVAWLGKPRQARQPRQAELGRTVRAPLGL